MPAITPAGNQSSIVVKVPVPTPVSPPTPRQQPAAPPVRRKLPTLILPLGSGEGAAPDSRSAYRAAIRKFESATGPDIRLARLVDTTPFAPKLRDEWSATYRQNYDHYRPSETYARTQKDFLAHPGHDVLADYLAENGDPREDVVRGRRLMGTAVEQSFKGADRPPGSHVGQIPFPRAAYYNASARHSRFALSDGTWLTFIKHSRGLGKIHWVVSWSGPKNDTPYTTVMKHDQFKAWLRRFEPDELSRIVKGMRNRG